MSLLKDMLEDFTNQSEELDSDSDEEILPLKTATDLFARQFGASNEK
jgi:hypothetical protein